MIKFIGATALTLSLSLSAFAYDADKAKDYEKFYANFTQKACANSQLFMKADDVMALIRQGNGYLILDVRTNAEAGVVAVSDKNSMQIELEHLFEAQNLDKIPTDVKVIAVCHSGTRGTIAAIGLKQLGFKNIYVLQGGLVALANATTPANAPMK